MVTRSTSSGRQCSVFTVTAALLLSVTVAISCVPSGARASAIRAAPSSPATVAGGPDHPAARSRRDVPDSAVAASPGRTLVRRKRTLLKLKPLIVLPAKLAVGAGTKLVGAGTKLVAGAKLGAKAVGLGAKALGVGAVGLKAVKKVAKVTIKAATSLGVKAVLLNFLFQKINQAIDFKTRLLSNLDQRNKQKNAQFLSPVLPPKSSAGSVGNKDDDDFLASGSPGDQQVLAQEQSSAVAQPSEGRLEDEPEVTFDANKVSLQVPDRLFGPSFTAVTGISQAIGTVIQNAAGRLARLVEAVKAAVFRKAAGLSSISNSSGGFAGNGGGGGATGVRGSRDAAANLGGGGGGGDELDADPLDEAAAASVAVAPPKKRDAANSTAGGE